MRGREPGSRLSVVTVWEVERWPSGRRSCRGGARRQRNERTLKPILLFAVIQRARHSATARASRGAGPECPRRTPPWNWIIPPAAGNRHTDDEFAREERKVTTPRGRWLRPHRRRIEARKRRRRAEYDATGKRKHPATRWRFSRIRARKPMETATASELTTGESGETTARASWWTRW